MLVFPNCKINIGLNIVGKRSDGYHNLETIFYPITKLYDGLEVLAQKTTSDQAVNLQLSGLPVSGTSESNLCVKAYQLLKKDFPELPAIDVCLHKAIPMGAGLGGGSADGAFMLKLLNEQFHLKLLQSQLLDYALQLGSDCPFFIINKPCFAEGRGEMLQEVALNLAAYSIVLIYPDVHVSTAAAFSGVKPAPKSDDLQELVLQPIETWKEIIVNDFETSVFAIHPILAQIKNKLYQQGAVYASMSGSGSTVYGIFPSTALPTEKLFPQYYELHASL